MFVSSHLPVCCVGCTEAENGVGPVKLEVVATGCPPNKLPPPVNIPVAGFAGVLPKENIDPLCCCCVVEPNIPVDGCAPVVVPPPKPEKPVVPVDGVAPNNDVPVVVAA